MTRLFVTAAIAAALVSTPAHAIIVNISAADSVGVEVTFGPGQYLIKWVGVADGGAYDSAGGITTCAGCSNGFSNGVVARDSAFGSADFEIDLFTTRTGYGTAAESLAAYKAGTSIYHDWARFVGGSLFESGTDGLIPNPFVGDPDDETLRFLVFDLDGTRTNNTGGVSVSIEQVADAVPEPATWAMLIAGFGMMGGAMRRKQTVTARFAC